MSFLNLIKKRSSIRKYKDKKVEREKIINCIEAARLAPSACNSQPWFYIIIDDIELKNEIAKKTFLQFSNLNQFTKNAPVLVVIISEKPKLSSKLGSLITRKDLNLIDIGISTQHFCLQATEEGLGTCMLGWFNEKAIKSILNIPKSKHIPLLISMGYPEQDTIKDKNRKDIESIYSFNKYKSN